MCATNIITNINCFKIIYTTFYELLHLVTISSPPGGGDFFEINIGFLSRVFGERRLTYICYTFALLKYTRFRSLIQILVFCLRLSKRFNLPFRIYLCTKRGAILSEFYLHATLLVFVVLKYFHCVPNLTTIFVIINCQF